MPSPIFSIGAKVSSSNILFPLITNSLVKKDGPAPGSTILLLSSRIIISGLGGSKGSNITGLDCCSIFWERPDSPEGGTWLWA
jgi:hypothetical protein